MSLISYPIIKQYLWYHNKFSVEYKGNTLPIIYLKYKYYMFHELSKPIIGCDELDSEPYLLNKKIYRCVSFPIAKQVAMEKKLRENYRIIYIDVNDDMMWKVRNPPLEMNHSNKFTFTGLFSKITEFINFNDEYIPEKTCEDKVFISIDMTSLNDDYLECGSQESPPHVAKNISSDLLSSFHTLCKKSSYEPTTLDKDKKNITDAQPENKHKELDSIKSTLTDCDVVSDDSIVELTKFTKLTECTELTECAELTECTELNDDNKVDELIGKLKEWEKSKLKETGSNPRKKIHKKEPTITVIDNYSPVQKISVICSKIPEGSGVDNECFDEDEFVIISRNDADL